ncbi:MAG: hypothetical protein ACJ798_00720 [Phenylobacterium sp.]
MSFAAIALSLFLQAQPAAEPPAAEAPPAPAALAEDPWPAGVPHDDYQLVAWCYGALRGYLDLHDQVMPEVTRIETTFRPPGRKLSDDMKVYADLQKAGAKSLKQMQAALTAAEKASLRPINRVGATAVAKGRSVWEGGPNVTKARLAQEWMSWALPAKCETTAKALEERATLLGASFKVNAESEPAPADAPAPAADAPAPAPEQPAPEPK